MKKTRELLEFISVKVVMFIGFGLFGSLAYWAAKYRHEYSQELNGERVEGYFDSKGINVLWMLGFFVVVWGLQRLVLHGSEERKRKLVHTLAVVWTILTGIALFIWVGICHITPVQDQLQVYYGAVEFSHGDFTQMTTYFFTYPHQYGIAFLYEKFLWIWESYKLFQYINVFFIMVIVYFVYKVADEIFGNPCISFYTIVCTMLFVPLYLYVNFVYGELWNMCFGIVTIWAVLKHLSTGKLRYSILAIVCMTIAMIARKNIVIWAIALIIMLMVYAIRHMQWQPVVLAVLLLVIPLGSVELVHLSYEKRSGIEIAPGAPSIMWVAMGMQDDWNGAGVYNGYNNSVFRGEAGGDAKVAAEIAKKYMKERIAEFVENPAMARDFYQHKIWEQWNEATYGSFKMTSDFVQNPEGLAWDVYWGDLKAPIFHWLNRYVFIIYFFIAMYALFELFCQRNIEKNVLLIAVIGGFLFSIIWESKSRYVFPHTILFFPLMACGIYRVQTICECACVKILQKIQERRQ